MKFSLTTTISDIVKTINSRGHVWVVGGAVRDLILGREPKDIDLATDLLPEETVSVTRELGLIRIPDEKAFSHGIVRVVDRDTGEFIDIATLRKDDHCDGRHAEVSFTKNLKLDLGRRDLRINAMATSVDPDGTILEILDPWEGQKDIENKIIDFVGHPQRRIREDYLRMLRACRFTALGPDWKIEQFTAPWIIHDAEFINTISKERIRDEIIKAHKYSNPGNFWRSLQRCQLLKYIIPPMELAVTQEGGDRHDEQVFEHLTNSLDAVCEFTDSYLLRLATVLHDIGKPKVAKPGVGKQVHFYKHEVEGASIAYQWMIDLKFSKKEIEYVVSLVRHHMFRFDSTSQDRTIRRWLQQVGPHWRDLITLRCADRRGNLAKKDRPMITAKMRELVNRAETILESGIPIFKEDLPVNGDDFKELGVPPGPIYKEIFSNLLGIILNDPGKNDRDWLLGYVRKQYIKGETSE